MSTIALPAPVAPVAPPLTSGSPDGPPAPASTMLAVLGRIGSHAGDPLSTTVTAPTHTIVVHVPDRAAYAAWCVEIETAAATVVHDALGELVCAVAVLHGWRVEVQLTGAGA